MVNEGMLTDLAFLVCGLNALRGLFGLQLLGRQLLLGDGNGILEFFALLVLLVHREILQCISISDVIH